MSNADSIKILMMSKLLTATSLAVLVLPIMANRTPLPRLVLEWKDKVITGTITIESDHGPGSITLPAKHSE